MFRFELAQFHRFRRIYWILVQFYNQLIVSYRKRLSKVTWSLRRAVKSAGFQESIDEALRQHISDPEGLRRVIIRILDDSPQSSCVSFREKNWDLQSNRISEFLQISNVDLLPFWQSATLRSVSRRQLHLTHSWQASTLAASLWNAKLLGNPFKTREIGRNHIQDFCLRTRNVRISFASLPKALSLSTYRFSFFSTPRPKVSARSFPKRIIYPH